MLKSSDFIKKFAKKESYFSRKAILTFEKIVLFLVTFRNGSARTELRNFFSKIVEDPLADCPVNKQAFFRARMKIKPEVFLHLSHVIAAEFAKFSDLRLWHGFRLLGMDGSSLQLPPTPDIWETFQPLTPSQKYGNNVPIGRFSCLHDVLNDFTLDAALDPWPTGEREQASRFFAKNLPSRSLILMDRGYPAAWLFEQIVSVGADYCARMPLGTWAVVDDFLASGDEERIVSVKPSPNSRGESIARHPRGGELTLRLVKVALGTGEFEVLATSLIDRAKWPVDYFGPLYHRRWGAEEGYKSYKSVIQLENFSGKSVDSVLQDVFAAVLGRNLATLASWEAGKAVDQQNERRKEEGRPAFKVNGANVLAVMKTGVVKLFYRGRRTLSEVLVQLKGLFAEALELSIPGRSNPREVKYPKAKFQLNYKPIT